MGNGVDGGHISALQQNVDEQSKPPTSGLRWRPR